MKTCLVWQWYRSNLSLYSMAPRSNRRELFAEIHASGCLVFSTSADVGPAATIRTHTINFQYRDLVPRPFISSQNFGECVLDGVNHSATPSMFSRPKFPPECISTSTLSL